MSPALEEAQLGHRCLSLHPRSPLRSACLQRCSGAADVSALPMTSNTPGVIRRGPDEQRRFLSTLTPVLEMLAMAAMKPFERPPRHPPHPWSSHVCLHEHGVSGTQPRPVFPPHRMDRQTWECAGLCSNRQPQAQGLSLSELSAGDREAGRKIKAIRTSSFLYLILIFGKRG